jgi:hypothetical protein
MPRYDESLGFYLIIIGILLMIISIGSFIAMTSPTLEYGDTTWEFFLFAGLPLSVIFLTLGIIQVNITHSQKKYLTEINWPRCPYCRGFASVYCGLYVCDHCRIYLGRPYHSRV